MKEHISQGDVLKIEHIGLPVLVTSKDFFNESGEVIGCPINTSPSNSPLHIQVLSDNINGYVHCEKLKLLDLNVRGYKVVGRIPMNDIINITDAIQGIFDYV